MTELTSKIFHTEKVIRLYSFHDLDLGSFTDNELRELIEYYPKHDERITKYIEKRKYCELSHDFIDKKIDEVQAKIDKLEKKAYSFKEISDEEMEDYEIFLKDLSKLEQDKRKINKYVDKIK